MTDIPKIVHQRLRVRTPEQHATERIHPEADVLNAFAEQVLSPDERESVLQHLALCEDCRDVMALVLPAVDLTHAPAASEPVTAQLGIPVQGRRNWFAWANLHWAHLSWAALAAGVAMAVLLVGPRLEHGAKNSPVSPVANQTAAPTGPPPVTNEVASGLATANPVPGKPERSNLRAGLAADQTKVMKVAPQVGARITVANHLDKAPPIPAAKLAAEPPSGAAAFGASTGANETVEVSSETAVVNTESSGLSSDSSSSRTLMARADAPEIKKAKPALPETETVSPTQTNVAGAPAQSPTQGRNIVALSTLSANIAAQKTAAPKQNASWTIVNGVLQRSFDGGHRWQTALQADRALLCYASGGREEIWAGGKAGILDHSIDGGATWSAIQVSSQGQRLSADITHIEASAGGKITLSTINHETWISPDNGKTWEKE